MRIYSHRPVTRSTRSKEVPGGTVWWSEKAIQQVDYVWYFPVRVGVQRHHQGKGVLPGKDEQNSYISQFPLRFADAKKCTFSLRLPGGKSRHHYTEWKKAKDCYLWDVGTVFSSLDCVNFSRLRFLESTSMRGSFSGKYLSIQSLAVTLESALVAKSRAHEQERRPK